MRPTQRQQFRLGELLLELLGGGRDPSVGHRQEAREHGVGISRHAFKEMRDGFPSVGRKTTGIDLKELVQRAPAVLDAIDGPEISALAKRLLLGPQGSQGLARGGPRAAQSSAELPGAAAVSPRACAGLGTCCLPSSLDM